MYSFFIKHILVCLNHRKILMVALSSTVVSVLEVKFLSHFLSFAGEILSSDEDEIDETSKQYVERLERVSVSNLLSEESFCNS